jgi:hypothetical protein
VKGIAVATAVADQKVGAVADLVDTTAVVGQSLAGQSQAAGCSLLEVAGTTAGVGMVDMLPADRLVAALVEWDIASQVELTLVEQDTGRLVELVLVELVLVELVLVELEPVAVMAVVE